QCLELFAAGRYGPRYPPTTMADIRTGKDIMKQTILMPGAVLAALAALGGCQRTPQDHDRNDAAIDAAVPADAAPPDDAAAPADASPPDAGPMYMVDQLA